MPTTWLGWVKLVLWDAPTFVIGTWLKLYWIVVALMVTVLWGYMLFAAARYLLTGVWK